MKDPNFFIPENVDEFEELAISIAEGDVAMPKDASQELIEKVTVSIVGISGDKYPGSGVIVRKEDNIYSVLTTAHIVCNLNNRSVDTEEFEVKTFDNYVHDSFGGSDFNIKCRPILKGKKKMSSTFCSAPISKAYPWPIDIAVLEFKSDKGIHIQLSI